MYCTGGIRCEVFSSLLLSRGWKDVRQLEGGVLAYGESSDTSEWEGNLFVFDDRLVVPIDGVAGGKLDRPIAKCVFCGTVAEMCFNCNSMRLVIVEISPLLGFSHFLSGVMQSLLHVPLVHTHTRGAVVKNAPNTQNNISSPGTGGF